MSLYWRCIHARHASKATWQAAGPRELDRQAAGKNKYSGPMKLGPEPSHWRSIRSRENCVVQAQSSQLQFFFDKPLATHMDGFLGDDVSQHGWAA